MSTEPRPLDGLRVMLSAAVPDELVGSPRAQGLFDALSVLSRRLFAAGAGLGFGGHPSITPLIHRAARRTGADPARLALYQVVNFRDTAPKEVFDTSVFPDVRWVGERERSVPENLIKMRDAMAADCQAAIFLGGRGPRPDTPLPGIRDEYQRFLDRNPNGPIYLLGLLAGETARLIADGVKEPNGLDRKRRKLVHGSGDIDLIAPLIVSDLKRRFGGSNTVT